MADSKISALPAATVPLAGTEVLPIVQSSTPNQVSVANLTAGRALSASSVTNSALTSGRVTYAGTSGVLQDSSGLVFDSSSNLGVGTSSPYSKLSVTQALQGNDVITGAELLMTTSTATNDRLNLNFSMNGVGARARAAIGAVALDASGGYNCGLVFYTRSAADGSSLATTDERMRISSNGIVTMSAYGAGTATFSAAGVISSVSDETWKIKDGVPVDPDSMLKKLEPGYWFYNDEKKETFGVDRQLGFYAQNVNAAIGPEAAPTPEEGKPWGYYDRSVLAVTVMSLQKALATIELLNARITALEGT